MIGMNSMIKFLNGIQVCYLHNLTKFVVTMTTEKQCKREGKHGEKKKDRVQNASAKTSTDTNE